MDFYYHLTASEELINLVDETLLQAIWESDETVTDDELVSLAIEVIKSSREANNE